VLLSVYFDLSFICIIRLFLLCPDIVSGVFEVCLWEMMPLCPSQRSSQVSVFSLSVLIVVSVGRHCQWFVSTSFSKGIDAFVSILGVSVVVCQTEIIWFPSLYLFFFSRLL
jgi:hypothetical protein